MDKDPHAGLHAIAQDSQAWLFEPVDGPPARSCPLPQAIGGTSAKGGSGFSPSRSMHAALDGHNVLHGHNVLLRVGIPQPGGRLLAAARKAGYPVLFSANAFMVHPDDFGPVAKFKKPDPEQFAGLDAALDSAGFVAQSRYRGFPWSLEHYLNLVAAWPWTWWAAMDCCVEPEVAGSRMEIFLRMAQTCQMLAQCRARARDRGLSDPMPVLQGWEPRDYLWCLDRLPLVDLPPLVGVGSMCRRQVHGPQGVLAVVQALDRELPAGTRLHLFGVKGPALSFLAKHPRIASVDSMAWDSAARRQVPTGRTAEVRAGFMHAWVQANAQRLGERTLHADQALFFDDLGRPSDELDAWLDLVVQGEIEMQSAAMHLHHLCIGA
jgi:hypothetical protein